MSVPQPLIWDSPSRDASGSMPLGNGDIGLNVWVEENGDLLFYVSKTDAWDAHARLLKLGRIRVSLEPNPFVAGAPFRQELDLASGCVRIQSAIDNLQSSILIWVDANRPVVRVELTSGRPLAVTAALELWRTAERTREGAELHCSAGQHSPDEREIVYPDTVLEAPWPDALLWCHRNQTSCWEATLTHQDMGDFIAQGRDPLLHRTFGGLLQGEGMERHAAQTLRTPAPCRRMALAVHVLTAQTPTVEAWQSAVLAQAAAANATASAIAFTEHSGWWQAFWQRSWIRVWGTPDADTVSQAYALQRFVSACAGRGAYPIKFNGSLFTVDAREDSECYDADYRRWGGGYWFQNTRLPYWPMLMAGDVEMLEPWFRMYRDALPLALARGKLCFGLDDAAMFPETMTFWGTFLNGNYGFTRDGVSPGISENRYIRRYWQGMLELLAVLLDAYAMTQDEALLNNNLLVLAPPFLRFYRDYFDQRDDAGKLLIKPSQSLETWQEAVNPLPDIAGLQWVLDGLLALPATRVPEPLRREWEALRAILPPVPTRLYGGNRRRLIPALQYDDCLNIENPELYAVFPYRLYGVGKPDLEHALNAFAVRQFKRTGGWHQDAIQAALLGLTDDARRDVVANASTPHAGSRFPAFWGPNHDWIPDQDHGGVISIALQRMLMQCVDDQIHLLPAWPREWNVDFRLHAPGRTVVEGRVEQGVLRDFRITPEARRRDVVVNAYNPPVPWQVSGVRARPAGGVAGVDATPPLCAEGLPSGGGTAAAGLEAWRVVAPDAGGFVNVRAGVGDRDGLVYLANRFVAPFDGRCVWTLGSTLDN